MPKPAKEEAPKQKKQIEITEITSSKKDDELTLKVGFRLSPSRTSFSRVTADLYFDEQKIGPLHLHILQGPLATDEAEFSSTLDMTGIAEGEHVFRVKMYELWSSGEKLTSTSRQATIKHTPMKREDRLIEVPIVKRTAGAGLEIVSDSEKNIYREIEKDMKEEAETRRDHW